ncbi:methyltransferase domain-containing protein [Candidatus Dojkabacteria bacterium]|nr:methyltransferase domain-containing protein [Candidatus Dojkabacteria bacterium]
MEEKKFVKKLYSKRFESDIEFRKQMWKVLCNNFFQKYVPIDSITLDVGAGYCEFINNIQSREKIALDINPDVKKFKSKNVAAVISPATNMISINDKSVDVVFVSNFFEHLTKEQICATLKEIHRVLRNNGKVLLLQPNIRYCYKEYWMFFDHITPLDDRSLSEVLRVHNFHIEKCMPKFLPFSTKSSLPNSIFLLKIYLRFPFLQKIFGKQVFIVARKRVYGGKT